MNNCSVATHDITPSTVLPCHGKILATAITEMRRDMNVKLLPAIHCLLGCRVWPCKNAPPALSLSAIIKRMMIMMMMLKVLTMQRNTAMHSQ